MITTNTMYELHTISIDIKIGLLEDQIPKLTSLTVKLIEYFENNKHLIPTTCSLENIKLGKGIKRQNEYMNASKYYNIQIDQYEVLYKKLIQKQEELDRLKSTKIPSKIFAFIIRRFNELLVEELVHRSYKLKDLYLGELSVIVNKGKKACINWGISLKNKQEILDRGEIPFIKEDNERCIKEGIEYKGIPWITMLPEYRMFYKWKTVTANRLRLPNITNFNFMPLRGDNSAVSMLYALSNSLSQEELILIYKNQNNANELSIS